MSFFDRTAYAFRRQVEETPVFGSPVNHLGIIGGMLINGIALNIIKTSDQRRFIQKIGGYEEYSESFVDVLRDDYTFTDLVSQAQTVWLGIRAVGLYDKLIRPASPDKRPDARIGNLTYQIFAMADDANDATVKLTVRRKQ